MRQGEFALNLNENVIPLRCTPAALRFAENKHGGIRNLLQKIYMVEYQTMLDIIEAGLIGAPHYDKELLAEEVFKHGTMNLIVPLTDYINLLGNGGKLPEVDKGATKTGEA